MQNKVVFITGSAKRIGAYTAQYLHNCGYNIVLHCHRSQDAGLNLMASLNKLRSDSAKLVQGDLTDPSVVAEIAKAAIDAFGRLDVLVNNASSFYSTPVGTIEESDWQALIGSNAQAPLFLTQACEKQLEKNQGVVINMADIHAQKPLKGHTVYCMAKAALVSMTQSLAQELAPTIRVNAVAPGAILWPEKELSDKDKENMLKHIPLGRLGQEHDIAQAIKFLIDASYITGQVLAVDGGRSIANTTVA
ncbi:pteridine reductase [Aliiglaciecola sp. LCG003]|uniref:pteridine reductase n=1 Tax=Aliiglaciecola sp. LCG003 TaxID=3053655 RepID=UPI002573F5ED|nr:pteridine reductase [Aliiglaciecola sp. LCG003]WJG07972.1 pteridine reductase [Aliiglaciecola sp. LCG003]